MPVKASVAAAKAVAANPAAADRAIAERIGVGKDTVRRAREVAHFAPPAKRIGKDGNPAAPIYFAEDADDEEGITADMIDAANATNRRRVFMRLAADSIRKAVGRGPSIYSQHPKKN